MTPDRFDAIVAYLKDPATVACDSRFLAWVKSSRFYLKNFPEKGLHDVLMRPARVDKRTKSDTSPPLNLTVLHARDLYDVTMHVHSVVFDHGGYKRVLAYLQSRYFGIVQCYVVKFCLQCPYCAHKKSRYIARAARADQLLADHYAAREDPGVPGSLSHEDYSEEDYYPDHPPVDPDPPGQPPPLCLPPPVLDTGGAPEVSPCWNDVTSTSYPEQKVTMPRGWAKGDDCAWVPQRVKSLETGDGGTSAASSPPPKRMKTTHSTTTTTTTTTTTQPRPHLPPPRRRPSDKRPFFSRVRADVIDMTHSPDGGCGFIAHVTDASRKLHVLVPLAEATPLSLARLLDERVLPYYGMPKSLRSNMGRGFVEELLEELGRLVEGGVRCCANGEPVVAASVEQEEGGYQEDEAKAGDEREEVEEEEEEGEGAPSASASYVVEELIAMLTAVERGSIPTTTTPGSPSLPPWRSWLPRIARSLNRDWHAFLRTKSLVWITSVSEHHL